MQPKRVVVDTLENVCRIVGLVYLLAVITKYRRGMNHFRKDKVTTLASSYTEVYNNSALVDNFHRVSNRRI